jgi:GDP-L-fucose synthase
MKVGLIGAGGLLGASLVRAAARTGLDLCPAPRAEVDARDSRTVETWLAAVRPDALIIAAALNGGIQANLAQPADFLAHNAAIALACIGAARRVGVGAVLYCASAALYPLASPQPLREADLFAGAADPSHLGYGAAKALGVRYCQAIREQDGLPYTALLLTNIYGPGQSWDEARSNVVAGLLKRLHQAREDHSPDVSVWGTGAARRDLIFGEDAAEAILTLAQRTDLMAALPDGLVNIASGDEISIRDLALLCARTVGYKGALTFDPTKPEGAARRVLDVSRLQAMGWWARTPLMQGLKATYAELPGRTTG